MPEPVTLTVWSDFLCPWCAVAAVRIRALADEPGSAVRLAWRAYLLRPEPQHRDPVAFARYTESWQRPATLEPGAGIVWPWSGDHAPPSYSLPPAVGARAAATFGPDAFDRYHRALLSGYFTAHRTVSDRAVLVAIASEIGLDAGAFDQVLTEHGNHLAGAVFAEYGDAVERGIGAVPTVEVGEQGPLLRGARDLAEYRAALTAATSA